MGISYYSALNLFSVKRFFGSRPSARLFDWREIALSQKNRVNLVKGWGINNYQALFDWREIALKKKSGHFKGWDISNYQALFDWREIAHSSKKSGHFKGLGYQ